MIPRFENCWRRWRRKGRRSICRLLHLHPPFQGQDGISRLEQRSDLLLSTLRGYIEAMGGNLTLLAEFPDQVPVKLSGIASMGTGKPPASAKIRRARATRA